MSEPKPDTCDFDRLREVIGMAKYDIGTCLARLTSLRGEAFMDEEDRADHVGDPDYDWIEAYSHVADETVAAVDIITHRLAETALELSGLLDDLPKNYATAKTAVASGEDNA